MKGRELGLLAWSEQQLPSEGVGRAGITLQMCPVICQASEDRQHGPRPAVPALSQAFNFQDHKAVTKHSHYLKLITSSYNQIHYVKNSNEYSDPQNSSLPNRFSRYIVGSGPP